MKDKFKDRYILLGGFFVIFCVIIIFQLVNLQIIHGQYYDDESQKRILRERDLAAPRGKILDRYGVPIAVNRVGYTAEIVRTKMEEEDRNAMFLKLVNIFKQNGDNYIKSLEKYLTINPYAFGTSVNTAKSLEKWKKEMAVKKDDIELMTDPNSTFEYLRTKFDIEKKYTDEDAYKIMCIKYEILIQGYSTINPLTLAKDISEKTVAEIEERNDEFPGVTTSTEPLRKYVDGQYVAHVLGYVRGMDGDEYKKLKDEGYKMNDIIGKAGIEKATEAYLRGIEGKKKVEVDIVGRQTEQLEIEPATPGNDVVLTIDMKLQRVAMDSLKRNIEKIRSQANYKTNFGDAVAGSAVAIDVNSGEILAMASYPSYDPSIFLAGPEDREAQKAVAFLYDEKNEGKPAFNRALQGGYAPGSTFKPLTAVAGLEEGVITPKTKYYDPGKKTFGGKEFICLEYRLGYGAHHDIDLNEALATSCNIYFHELGYNLGIDNLAKWAKLFGLGDYTGIDIPNEYKGTIASKEFKWQRFKDDWRPADTAQAAIGQLYNSYTPLQLANYISTLANGGKKYKPHLIKRVVKYDNSIVMEKKPEYDQISLKKETVDAVRQGMMSVTGAEDGTAREAFRDFTTIKVAGKTGTAETGNEANHSSNALFVSFAPAENPQIAVAVVVERGAWGSNTAPIAADILREYFNMNSGSSSEEVLKPDQVVFTR